MSIAIICGNTEESAKRYQWYIDQWQDALLAHDDTLVIEHWPNIQHPKQIEMVLVWDYASGVLNDFPNLRCIASIGAGVDHIMQDANRPATIPVVRVVDQFMAKDIMHYVVATTLYYSKRFDRWDALNAQQKWEKSPPFRIDNPNVGILGLGHLGQTCANALAGLGLNVLGWSRTPKNMPNITCFHGDAALPQFLHQTHILICLLPLTPQTTGILNTSLFNQLPKGAFLINLARGQHLVTDDLLHALDTDQLAGATLDVHTPEPLPSHHPFWQHPNIRITPHIASVTSPESVAEQIVKNYHLLMENNELINQVDLAEGY